MTRLLSPEALEALLRDVGARRYHNLHPVLFGNCHKCLSITDRTGKYQYCRKAAAGCFALG